MRSRKIGLLFCLANQRWNFKKIQYWSEQKWGQNCFVTENPWIFTPQLVIHLKHCPLQLWKSYSSCEGWGNNHCVYTLHRRSNKVRCGGAAGSVWLANPSLLFCPSSEDWRITTARLSMETTLLWLPSLTKGRISRRFTKRHARTWLGEVSSRSCLTVLPGPALALPS